MVTFKNDKEISKKILDVKSARDLIAQSLAQHTGCVLDRLLKYSNDFREYIDVDTNVDVKDFDRFQVFLSARGCHGHKEASEVQVQFALLLFPVIKLSQ